MLVQISIFVFIPIYLFNYLWVPLIFVPWNIEFIFRSLVSFWCKPIIFLLTTILQLLIAYILFWVIILLFWKRKYLLFRNNFYVFFKKHVVNNPNFRIICILNKWVMFGPWTENFGFTKPSMRRSNMKTLLRSQSLHNLQCGQESKLNYNLED